MRSPNGLTFQFEYDKVIRYSCIKGFMLNGNGGRKCLASGTVNDTSPVLCNDINECVGSHSCHKNAGCMNTIGSYSCSCKSGFNGDGRKCYGEVFF